MRDSNAKHQHKEGTPITPQHCCHAIPAILGKVRRMMEGLTAESIGRPILTGPPPPPLVGR